MEECGNMLIMEAAVAITTGSVDFARSHMDTLKKWCGYLVKYGADPEKAYFAGLLHDVMKNAAPEEQLQIIEKADIMLSPSERLNRKLWHAIAGAAFLKLELHITDEDIIGAVRWHTTGKANMTQLEKIVYLADFISEDRKYPDVDKVRELSEQSIESAMLYTQRYCISKLLADGMIIDPSSVDCYNELITERSSEK